MSAVFDASGPIIPSSLELVESKDVQEQLSDRNNAMTSARLDSLSDDPSRSASPTQSRSVSRAETSIRAPGAIVDMPIERLLAADGHVCSGALGNVASFDVKAMICVSQAA